VRSIDFVFTDGTNWDNNFTHDWHITIPVPSIISDSNATFGNYAIFHIVSDMPCFAAIEWGLTELYGNITWNNTLATMHDIELTGLSIGTTYHYRIILKVPEGILNSTADRTFTSLQAIFEPPIFVLACCVAGIAITMWIARRKR
jgi:hypothetical protein